MKKIISILLIFALVFIIGCTNMSNTTIQKFDKTKVQSDEYIEPSDAHNQITPLIGLDVGNTPPDFTISDINNNKIILSEFKDEKPVLLYYMATWCPYCTQDFNTLSRLYQEYQDDVPIVVMSLDVSEDANVLTEYKKKYPKLENVIFAPGPAQVIASYKVRSTTTKYAITKDGTILYKGAGAFDENQWRTLLEALKNA